MTNNNAKVEMIVVVGAVNGFFRLSFSLHIKPVKRARNRIS